MTTAAQNFPRLQHGLAVAAQSCAALSLLVAPFHASAGWRGGLLLLAALAIAGLRGLRHDASALFPADPRLRLAVAWWALATLAWSVFFAPHEMGEWKRDVLTPILALPVFFILTETARDLTRWLVALTVGLVLLTLFLLNDPTDAMERMRQPWYGGVGSLTTWLVALAALLPWMVREAVGSRVRQAWLAATLGVMLICAYFTLNRTIWGCFAAMLAIHAVANMLPPHAPRLKLSTALLTIVIGAALFGSLAVSSVSLRFEHQIIARAEADPRAAIWRESTAVIADNAVSGVGYGIGALREKLMARMPHPDIAEHYGHAHNLLLNYTLQMGVTGLFTIAALLAAPLAAFIGIRRRGGADEVTGLCGILLVSAIFLRNMTDDFFNRHNALLFWAITGMLLGLARARQHGQDATHPHPAP